MNRNMQSVKDIDIKQSISHMYKEGPLGGSIYPYGVCHANGRMYRVQASAVYKTYEDPREFQYMQMRRLCCGENCWVNTDISMTMARSTWSVFTSEDHAEIFAKYITDKLLLEHASEED